MQKKTDSFTRKKRLYSAEAATASILIHVVLLLLAGSIVAIRYVQKKNAEFTVTTTQPKLQRRQLQMPSKLERVRQTSKRPRIVSRTVSTAVSEFSLPDMGDLGERSTQKFSMPFAQSGRDFGALTRGVSLGAPQIKFLGIRGEGEKVIFILEASLEMLAEESGGQASCDYINEQLKETLSTLPSSVLFNVLLHNGETVCSFRPKMIPVTEGNRDDVFEWVAVELNDSANPGLEPEQNNYTSDIIYQTAIGKETSGWLRAIQSAFESRPDAVFIVGRDWGQHSISREKGQRLLDFSLWEVLGGGGAFSVKGSAALREDRKIRNDLLKEAVETIGDEKEERDEEKLPAPFIHNLIDYMQYSRDQIFDHVDAVYQSNYVSYQLAPPRVHVVRLVPAEKEGVSDSSTEKLRELARNYTGEFRFLNGSDIEMDAKRRKLASEGDNQAEQGLVGFEKSDFDFFNVSTEGSRVAVVLDVSEKMVSPALGGTNLCAFLKNQLRGVLGSLKPETGVNVILCDSNQVALFRPEMVPVSKMIGLADWFEAFSRDSQSSGLNSEQNNYTPSVIYDTPVGSDVQGIPLALQVAMEQQADVILVVTAGLGRMPVNPVKARRLLDFSIWGALGSVSSSAGGGVVDAGSGGDPGTGAAEEVEEIDLGDEEDGEGGGVIEEPDEGVEGGGSGSSASSGASSGGSTSGGLLRSLKDDRRQQAGLIRQAMQRIAEENKARKKEGLPLGFVHNIFDYIEYTTIQIQEHLSAVSVSQYPMIEDEKPVLPLIHFAWVVEKETTVSRVMLREFSGLLNTYSGEMVIFRGADSDREIRKANRMLDLRP